MEPVKIGVIGLGWVAQVVHLPLLLKLPEAELVAVSDRDRSRARLVAEKFGLRNVYTDVGQMLEKVEMQAVVVSTSTDAHKEITLAALKAGKDVLVEKPIARRYAEAAAMADAAREHKRKLMVGMNHRFRPDTMILKSFIQGKELGKIFATKAGWLRRRTNDSAWTLKKEKSGGGVLVDLGIVMLDMCLWMLGYPDVKRISASTYHNKTKQVEDTALVRLLLKSGAQIDIEVSWSMYLHDDVYYCNVYGSDGSASLNPLRIDKELHGSLVNLAPAKVEPPQHLFRRSYENELRHFLGAVRNIHPVISTAEEAVQRMRIIEAMYRSARLGKEIALP